MPSEYDIAVDFFVNPLDLLVKGEKIRIWMVVSTIVFLVARCVPMELWR
jgi:hypothetical protein